MGVNSNLDNGTHVLMWDFDNTTLDNVRAVLRLVQVIYSLSDIHILETNKAEGNFIAYCFSRQEWRKAIEIVVRTPRIDWNFVRLSIYRGWFTLRVGAKQSGTPKIVGRLEGFGLPDCKPDDLKNWVEYETISKE